MRENYDKLNLKYNDLQASLRRVIDEQSSLMERQRKEINNSLQERNEVIDQVLQESEKQDKLLEMLCELDVEVQKSIKDTGFVRL